MVYTEEMKRELEEVVRSIDGVTDIFWRDDPWEGCECLGFKVETRAFKITITQRGIPVAYYYLNGYWRIDVVKGDYSPLDVQKIVYKLCLLLDCYDTEDIRNHIVLFSKMKEYMNCEPVDELEEERMMLRLAGAFIREHKMKAERDGILLQVMVALCNTALMSYYKELEQKRMKRVKRNANNKKYK
jgi:hypothetical protein